MYAGISLIKDEYQEFIQHTGPRKDDICTYTSQPAHAAPHTGRWCSLRPDTYFRPQVESQDTIIKARTLLSSHEQVSKVSLYDVWLYFTPTPGASDWK